MTLTHETFMSNVMKEYLEHMEDLRYGQVLFNLLAFERPDISQQIHATRLDPFYKEKPSQETFDFIQNN